MASPIGPACVCGQMTELYLKCTVMKMECNTSSSARSLSVQVRKGPSKAKYKCTESPFSSCEYGMLWNLWIHLVFFVSAEED